jgi:signal transduction histidine kinase
VQLFYGRYVDSLGDAFIWVPLGLAGLAVGLALLRPLEAVCIRLVRELLGERPVTTRAAGWPNEAVRVHATAYGVANAFFVVIWALTSRGYFWPIWPILALGVPLAVHAWVTYVETVRAPGWCTRALYNQIGISAVIAAFLTCVWAVTSRGYFWPVWPMLALALLLGVHALVAYLQRNSRERIEVLEQTRAGAVDQQESDLARIERDLHDGAQARLVALGMSIGMAEQKLATDPEAAQALLAEARQGTKEALEELRSLARGIRPPVLADRGLEAAIMALADRTPVRVDVHVQLTSRPPGAVETAAYYVVAEALANAGKHAEPQRVDITVRDDGGSLVVEVLDDGVGGADPAGSGLRGLARRVEALDGTLTVRSPAGGPTIVKAVVPCGS